jgi:polysaccharide export outer membrane protein
MVLKIKLFGVMLSLLVLFGAQNIWGEEYIIGTEDVLSITFWQEPDLNTRAKVRKDGMITLPIIGEVKAEGLSPKKLSQSILEKISLYNANISQATVEVEEYNHRKIYVQGEVRSPGAFGFETIPDLWGAIREAGGPTEFADLNSVSIIRGDGDSEVQVVDLEASLKAGSLKGLPKLKPKDTIWIPRSSLSTTITYLSGKREPVFNLGRGALSGRISVRSTDRSGGSYFLCWRSHILSRFKKNQSSKKGQSWGIASESESEEVGGGGEPFAIFSSFE